MKRVNLADSRPLTLPAPSRAVQKSSRTRQRPAIFTALCFVSLAVSSALAAVPTDSRARGTVQDITVHGRSLEGNLDNDPADRQVSVYLPPSYNRDVKRRYPVVYFLHGFTDTNAKWFGPSRNGSISATSSIALFRTEALKN